MQFQTIGRKHRMIFIMYAAFILLWVVVALSFRIYGNRHLSNLQDVPLVEEAVTADRDPLEIGIFAENFYGFEPAHETFKADGWIWLIWSPRLQTVLAKHGLTPEQIIHFTNLVEDWDSRVEPGIEKIMRLPDGRHYQKFRFSGYFNVNGIDYRKYPFQSLSLPISIELSDIVTSIDQNRVLLVPDRAHSGVGDYIGVSGYLYDGFEVMSGLHVYPSSLGLDHSPDVLKRSQVRFKANYQKSPSTTFIKLLLPVLMVMALTLFSPSISVTGWDVRVGIPPTALLSLIFLQEGYRGNLPELAYLTYLDMIYNLCYLMNLILFGLFLWGSNVYDSAKEEERPAVIAFIEKIDHRFQVGLICFVLFSLVANWLSITRPFTGG